MSRRRRRGGRRPPCYRNARLSERLTFWFAGWTLRPEFNIKRRFIISSLASERTCGTSKNKAAISTLHIASRHGYRCFRTNGAKARAACPDRAWRWPSASVINNRRVALAPKGQKQLHTKFNDGEREVIVDSSGFDVGAMKSVNNAHVPGYTVRKRISVLRGGSSSFVYISQSHS